MGKPKHSVYLRFAEKYAQLNQQERMNQFLVPYLMSSHPGCTMKDAVALAEYLRDISHQPEQVQDFYPTPSTLSTVMYYTGLDPQNDAKGLRAQKSARKSNAARAHAVPQSGELCAGEGGARSRRTGKI